MPLDALQKLYELQTPKSFGREGFKSLGFVCSPSFFSLPAKSHLSLVGWFSRMLSFCSLYYPWGRMGTTRSLWLSQEEKGLRYQSVVLLKLWFVVMFGVNTWTTQIVVIVIETSRDYKICSYLCQLLLNNILQFSHVMSSYSWVLFYKMISANQIILQKCFDQNT